MRIQNEGNGKSSWWILNHDAKSEKTKRRNRSSSVDSDAGGPKVKTKRGRKATKRGEVDDRPQSPSKCRGNLSPKSPISGEPSVILEDTPMPFPLADYRHRSSSNTSTVSSIGRLSPIPSHDEEEPADMSMSPAQDHGNTTPSPVAMTDELIENMKENLNMTIGQPQGDLISHPQFRNPCSNGDSNVAGVQSISIDSSPSFVEKRYPATANEFYSAPSRKHTGFTPAKITQKIFNEQNVQRLNGVYLRGNANSPSQFTLPERSVSQSFSRPPPACNTAIPFNNYQHDPKIQQALGRLSTQGNQYSSNIPMASDSLPMISVEMADRLPVDTDIEFVEGDLECDVENMLRSDFAFNDGYLDFNLDNYVSTIAVPEMSLQGYVSGNMVH